MNKISKTLNLVVEQGVLPLYFHPDTNVSLQILKALYSAGVRVVEYTNGGETAVNNFLQLRKFADKELAGLKLGVGNIRNKLEATEFINQGANFLICPGVIPAVAELAKKNDLLWVPGCMTATEIINADDLGAQLVKLYPASLLGCDYLVAMKEVFPELLFMPAAGIETGEENLNNWFKSGASAVEIGRKLISKYLVERKDYAGIGLIAKQTLQIVKELKSR